MNKFQAWYIRNQDAITWFIVGLLVSNTLEQLARGQYIGAVISAGLAAINYYFARVRLT